MLNTDTALWVLMAAASLHVVDEHALGWQGWATGYFGSKLGKGPSWSDFWVTNASLITTALACAVVGWSAPAFALAMPAQAIINALLFHIRPSVQARRMNPGLITAVTLYLPIGIWAYVQASSAGVLSLATVIGSIVFGALMLVLAIGIIAVAARYRYADVDPAGEPVVA